METIFPDDPSIEGRLLLGVRRLSNSPVASDNIESVVTVLVKQAFTVTASNAAPANGSLQPDPAGPTIFEGDFPGNFVTNGDFSDVLVGWSEFGGADATAGDLLVTLNRSGGAGSLRSTASFGRSTRDRGVGLSVNASANAGLATPLIAGVASGETGPIASPGSFPVAAQQPVLLSDYARFSSAVSSSNLSVQLPTADADGDTIVYEDVVVSTVEYESDLVAFKPEADLIVIADNDPVPLTISRNGVEQISQAGVALPLLTGLGWQDRFGTPRESQGGDFLTMTQALPDDFDNLYLNGFHRDRRQVVPVDYPQPGDEILIERVGGERYGFVVPSEQPTLEHAWFVGSGQDDPCLWKYRQVDMHLDTLVIEPDRDVAYAVWRSVWPLEFNDPDDATTVPFANNRRVTVTMEGA